MTKLIFCFDGTCNDPGDAGDFSHDGSISNVLKLHALLGGKLTPRNGENDKTPGQRSFYYSGIGTYGGYFRKKLNAMFAPPGADMEQILASGKKDLDENFKDGDEIFIFGFSRGAAIARMFASKIGKESGRRVKFLGVFDTVAATKNSLDLDPDTFPASGIVFEDGTMGEHIDEAAHLVSIDEKRIAFQPTLFNKDKRVTEVWFAGVHSDIGGGYWFDGLSDITLKFHARQGEKRRTADSGRDMIWIMRHWPKRTTRTMTKSARTTSSLNLCRTELCTRRAVPALPRKLLLRAKCG